MHPEFSTIIQKITDDTGEELKGDEIYQVFNDEYLNEERRFRLHKYEINAMLIGDETGEKHNAVEITAHMDDKGEIFNMRGRGNGPIDAFFHALVESGHLDRGVKLSSYSEHALSEGTDSQAVAYIQMTDSEGSSCFGVGMDPSINGASLKALLCALDRMERLKKQ